MHDSRPAKTSSNEIHYNYCYAKRGRNEYDDEVEDDDEQRQMMNKLKGVVCQQNGDWGAQIYANHHQRIWLGTFKSQTEAAMAYDSATIKLRTGSEIHQEVQFQSHNYSVETVLTMIRNGTYQSKFATFQSSNQLGHNNNNNNVNVIKLGGGEEKFCCSQLLLFRKELTPSDVGKLNRLVIPKKHAVTYFPCNGNNNNDDDKCIDIEVVFYDKLMRLWKFRYCYWKSSQSYVFTRGWNRFVKDKKLKARDVIAFYMCQQQPTDHQHQHQHQGVFSLIDVIYHHNNDNIINANAVALADDDQRRRHCFGDGEQILGNKLICSEVEEEEEEEEVDDDEGQDGIEDFNGVHSENNNNNNNNNNDSGRRRGLRLFGVSIN